MTEDLNYFLVMKDFITYKKISLEFLLKNFSYNRLEEVSF